MSDRTTSGDSRRPVADGSHYHLSHHNLILRLGSARIRWLFRHSHDWYLLKTHILPWALADREYEVREDLAADCTISVYGTGREDQEYLDSLGGMVFCLNGESAHAAIHFSTVLVFGGGEDCHPNSRWAPTLIFWSPPTSNPKLRKCSAVESGRYPWRNELVSTVRKELGGLDGFGSYFSRPVPGAHARDNRKYLCLRDFAFSVAIENSRAADYITEKMNDIILNEAVALYSGAPNWQDYFAPEAVVPLERATEIDWRDWRAEYDRRRRGVLAQKEALRRRFNVLSYFIAVVENEHILAERRPITLTSRLRGS